MDLVSEKDQDALKKSQTVTNASIIKTTVSPQQTSTAQKTIVNMEELVVKISPSVASMLLFASTINVGVKSMTLLPMLVAVKDVVDAVDVDADADADQTKTHTTINPTNNIYTLKR